MPTNERFFAKNIAGQDNQVFDYIPSVLSQGDFQRISGLDVLINSIRTLLLTPLGFYPFDPEYGSLLYKKVFDPLDQQSRSEIEFEVRNRIQEFDSRIVVTEVNIFEISTDGKAFQVELSIKRGEISGEVSVHLPGPNHQFAFEDG